MRIQAGCGRTTIVICRYMVTIFGTTIVFENSTHDCYFRCVFLCSPVVHIFSPRSSTTCLSRNIVSNVGCVSVVPFSICGCRSGSPTAHVTVIRRTPRIFPGRAVSSFDCILGRPIKHGRGRC